MRRIFFSASAASLAMWVSLAFLAADAGRTFPNVKLSLLDGTPVHSKDLAGKITVVDFWGTWCKPCLEEIPDYNRFWAEYRDKDVQFIAVAVESGTEEELRKAIQRFEIRYPVAAPPNEVLEMFGDVDVFPTTWVFDRQGKLIKEFLGNSPTKHQVLRETVDRLLRNPGR